jgi:hypothetical protein
VKFFSSKRRVAAAAVILLALFTIRPGASRLKSRIIYSISAGVNRPVDIGSVHVQLLPRPAFTLQNLVVYDDPAFGAEPLLRASEVTAPIRLTSLFRGRLEIARLDLTEPSLNLVHRQDGHWNLEALLERSAHIPLAPTGKARSERRPGFPYIEATSGRINFKNGPEKKPYALTNADFSLWQESENTWGIRLKAQPFRTDMNLNDTGLLLVSGTWQRAEAIRDTPLVLNLELSQAQLGQISKLITGNDQGWRGEILLDLALKGTPAALQIAGSSSIDDFRRYDMTSRTALRLRGRCDAEYSTETHEFTKVMCNAPVGKGLITLTGDMGFPGSHRYSASMTAEKVPAGALIMLLQRVKRNLPDDLAADGTLEANVAVRNDGGSSPQWQGHGSISEFHLGSDSSRIEIGPETLPFAVSTDSTDGSHKRVPSNRTLQTEMHIEVGPLHLGVARPGAATVRGFMSPSLYNFAVSGDMEIARALRLARVAGLPAIASRAEGWAQLDLQIAGNWTSPGKGFAVPQVTGNTRLRNVQVVVPGTGAPVEMVSAEMQLLPDAVHLSKLNAKAAGAVWAGFIDLPRGCGTPDACPVHFSINTKRLAFTDLNAWINPGAKKRPWYRVLGATSETRPAWWTTLHAIGKITADRFDLHQIQATQVSANFNVNNGKLQLSGLNADLLGGTHSGDWKVEFARKPALCKGTGTLAGMSLASIAEAMNNAWVTGFGTGSYEVSGPCPSDFWQSAEGKLHVEVNDGIFPHLLLSEDTEPLRTSEIKGEARLHGGTIDITNAQVIALDSSYRLTGTASLKREVNLKLMRLSSGDANVGYSISGTLETPRVTPFSRNEQATLKTPTPK